MRENMLRGVNKNVIVIKTDRDSRFETAYFVLRSNNGEVKGRGAAISEAKELIHAGEDTQGGVRRRGKILCGALCFALGVLLGAGGAILIQVLL